MTYWSSIQSQLWINKNIRIRTSWYMVTKTPVISWTMSMTKRFLVAIYCPPNITPPKKNRWTHHSNCIKAVWLFLFHRISGSVFFPVWKPKAQGVGLVFGTPWGFWGCSGKARGVVIVGEVLCVKNIKWLVALRQKTRGFGLVSLYHFKLAYVMLMSYV